MKTISNLLSFLKEFFYKTIVWAKNLFSKSVLITCLKNIFKSLFYGLIGGVGVFISLVGLFYVYSLRSPASPNTGGGPHNDLAATTGETLTLQKWNGLVQRVSGINTKSDGNVFFTGGNVGIGTKNPGKLLEISSGESGSIGGLLRLSKTGDNPRERDINLKSGNFVIGDNSALQDRFTITSSGNVGIGTTGPGEKLDIAGGNGRVASGYNWLTNSDRRYKKNITTLTNSLESVANIRGVRYDLIEDENEIEGQGKHIGFIAQELEEEYPEFVETDENGYKAVSYDKVTAVLVEAIKELKEKNDLLEQKNNSLELRLELLENK